jgi:peptide-methionine (S)-S-oxide reductase
MCTPYVVLSMKGTSLAQLATLSILALLAACKSEDRAEPKTAATSASAAAARLGVNPGGALQSTKPTAPEGHELAAFAAGCFWGVEDAFRHAPGVVATTVGYTGGHTENPNYETVCSHTSGHAETVLVEFDPTQVSYARLVNIFFQVHDPTTMNRQGPDVGDQYRSAVFTFSEAQAEAFKLERDRAQKDNAKPIVTEVKPLGAFYVAEGYHQQYTERTGVHGCPIHKFK